MLACLVLGAMWGGWCVIAGALANDGTVAPLCVTGVVCTIVILWYCLISIMGWA